MNKFMTKCYLKLQELKGKGASFGRRLTEEERGGAEIIAAIILLAVVVLLGVLFREKIQDLLNSIWGGVDEQVDKLGGNFTIAPSST